MKFKNNDVVYLIHEDQIGVIVNVMRRFTVIKVSEMTKDKKLGLTLQRLELVFDKSLIFKLGEI